MKKGDRNRGTKASRALARLHLLAPLGVRWGRVSSYSQWVLSRDDVSHLKAIMGLTRTPLTLGLVTIDVPGGGCSVGLGPCVTTRQRGPRPPPNVNKSFVDLGD